MSDTTQYGSIVAFAVSENSGESAWGALVHHVVSIVSVAPVMAYDVLSVHVGDALKNTEEAYKKDFAVTAVPKAYRSAKCIALKAIEAQVSLLGADGQPKGKTQVEKEIKGKETPPIPKDLVDRWNTFLSHLHQEQDKDKVEVVLKNMADVLDTFRC